MVASGLKVQMALAWPDVIDLRHLHFLACFLCKHRVGTSAYVMSNLSNVMREVTNAHGRASARQACVVKKYINITFF